MATHPRDVWLADGLYTERPSSLGFCGPTRSKRPHLPHPYQTEQDFYGIKKSLRVPPVSDIRRDCRRIIAGLDGEPKVKQRRLSGHTMF